MPAPSSALVHLRPVPPPGRRSPQAGQVVPIMAVVLVLVGLLGAGLVRLAATDARRAAAQAAADGAALAGAAEGRAAADAVAAGNDAAIVSYHTSGLDVIVIVDRRGHRAEARARWDLGPVGAPAGRWPGDLTPKFAD